MFYAGDLGEDLFGRHGYEGLDVLGRGTWEGDQYIGHRYVDLRFFLPRRDQHGENPEQCRNECDERR